MVVLITSKISGGWTECFERCRLPTSIKAFLTLVWKQQVNAAILMVHRTRYSNDGFDCLDFTVLFTFTTCALYAIVLSDVSKQSTFQEYNHSGTATIKPSTSNQQGSNICLQDPHQCKECFNAAHTCSVSEAGNVFITVNSARYSSWTNPRLHTLLFNIF